MTTKMILAALAAVLSGTSIQTESTPVAEATPSTQVAPAPQVKEADTLFFPASATTAAQEKTVTVSLEDGTVKDVVKLLKAQGVNFVIADGDAKRKFSLNFTDVPVSEAIDAIGSALGGSFEKRGSIYVYQNGMNWMAAPASTRAFFPGAPTAPSAPRAFVAPRTADDRQVFIAPRAMSEKDRKEFERSMVEMRRGLAEIKPMDAKARQDMERAMKELGDSKSFAFSYGKPMSEKERKEFEAEMKKLGVELKELDKELRGLSISVPAEVRSLSPEKRAEVERAIANAQVEIRRGTAARNLAETDRKAAERAMDDARIEIRRAGTARTLSETERKAVERAVEGAQIEIRRSADDRGKAIAEAREVKVRAGATKELFSSITKEQWAKHAKQGHLKLSDLTAAQRKMLGISGTGEITIQMNVDGKKLTIKN